MPSRGLTAAPGVGAVEFGCEGGQLGLGGQRGVGAISPAHPAITT
jgi:hypothetical protein